jgi:hypothetical protein
MGGVEMSARSVSVQLREGGGFMVVDGDSRDPHSCRFIEVWIDGRWLYIQEDPYESSLMMDIGALPALIEALTKIQEGRP